MGLWTRPAPLRSRFGPTVGRRRPLRGHCTSREGGCAQDEVGRTLTALGMPTLDELSYRREVTDSDRIWSQRRGVHGDAVSRRIFGDHYPRRDLGRRSFLLCSRR